MDIEDADNSLKTTARGRLSSAAIWRMKSHENKQA
jgi:hypothetical protein